MSIGDNLNDRQKRFCQEYIIDYNATQAAIRAGYSAKTAEATASRLLRNVNLKPYIDHLKTKQQKRTEITADRVLEELAKMAFYNSQDFTDDEGRLLSIHEMPRELTACITSIKQRTILSGEDRPDILETEYKVADKIKSVELLGKYLKMFSDRVIYEAPEGISFNMSITPSNNETD